MDSKPLQNLLMFAKLCGADALQNIVLVWDEVDKKTELKREKEAKVPRPSVVRLGLEDHRPLLAQWKYVLQKEMADMERQLNETARDAENCSKTATKSEDDSCKRYATNGQGGIG